jgi:hypothetical protein
MIVLTMNIRGLGSRVKRRKVRELVASEKVDFLALQETKLEVVTEALIYGLWGGDDCDWSYTSAVGNSGGILSIWRKSLFVSVFSFSGCGFVGVCLETIQDQCRCYVVNVYVKCNLIDKRRLWGIFLDPSEGLGVDVGVL